MKNLTYPAIVLMTLSALGIKANADDFFYGSTNSSSIALIDASTATVLSNHELINAQTDTALGTSLRIASNGTSIFGVSQNGALYSLDLSHTVMDVNHTLGYDATLQSSGIGISDVVGLAFTSPTLLDVSTSSSLYQYNTITHSPTFLFNFANNTQIAGIAKRRAPCSACNIAQVPAGGRLQGITQTAFLSLAMGQSGTLYVSDENDNLYTYNLTTESYNPLGALHGISVSAVDSFAVVPEPGFADDAWSWSANFRWMERPRPSPVD